MQCTYSALSDNVQLDEIIHRNVGIIYEKTTTVSRDLYNYIIYVFTDRLEPDIIVLFVLN